MAERLSSIKVSETRALEHRPAWAGLCSEVFQQAPAWAVTGWKDFEKQRCSVGVSASAEEAGTSVGVTQNCGGETDFAVDELPCVGSRAGQKQTVARHLPAKESAWTFRVSWSPQERILRAARRSSEVVDQKKRLIVASRCFHRSGSFQARPTLPSCASARMSPISQSARS